MKGFRFRRGIVGDVMQHKNAPVFGFYRFEIDVPEYDWALDQQKGDEFADLVESWIRGPIEKQIAADADKLDAPRGFLQDSASSSFGGIGARDLKSDGTPDWGGVEIPQSQFSKRKKQKGHHHYGRGAASLFDEYWTQVRNYDTSPSAIEDARDVAIDVGNNFQANSFISMGIPFPKSRDDSKPFFLQWKRFVWNVHTVEIGLLGPVARIFFEKGDAKRDKHRIKALRETKEFKKRSDASKAAWKVRKKAAKVNEAYERASRVALRKLRKREQNFMYRELLALVMVGQAKRDAAAKRYLLALKAGHSRKLKQAEKLLKLEQSKNALLKLEQSKSNAKQSHKGKRIAPRKSRSVGSGATKAQKKGRIQKARHSSRRNP